MTGKQGSLQRVLTFMLTKTTNELAVLMQWPHVDVVADQFGSFPCAQSSLPSEADERAIYNGSEHARPIPTNSARWQLSKTSSESSPPNQVDQVARQTRIAADGITQLDFDTVSRCGGRGSEGVATWPGGGGRRLIQAE